MKKKLWLIIGICISVLLVAGIVLYFAVYRPKQLEQKRTARLITEYRENKRQQYMAENEKYDDYEVDVAFIGDSLTDGYDLQKYYPQFVTANRGIGGDTTFDLEGRLQVSVYDLKPKVVVMLIGANNMDTMMDNYESILQGLQEHLPDSKIVLLSLTAMGGEHWGRKNQLAAYNNVTIKLLAEKYGYTFIDLYTPLYDVTTREVREGYTVLTEQITPVLEKLLA